MDGRTLQGSSAYLPAHRSPGHDPDQKVRVRPAVALLNLLRASPCPQLQQQQMLRSCQPKVEGQVW